MIRYALTCENDHQFESWFQSTDAFEKLEATGMVSCAVCGTTQVRKSVMAPRVVTSRRKSSEQQETPKLKDPASPAEQVLAELRRKVEENSDYVGESFAKEARAMHFGEVPERSIYGEARPDEAKSLIEDGIPVTPLPFMPNRKTN